MEYYHTIEKTELKDYWRTICNLYLKQFCKKHDYLYEPDMWVVGDPGTIICINDFFVAMDDMRYDIDNNITPEMYEKWYWKALDFHEKTGKNYLNYQSFCKGAPEPKQ